MKVVADRDAADAQALNQVMVNEILRRGSSAGLVERRDHGTIQSQPAASITARWPRWTPSKLPMATTAPRGISAAGVVSRITVKPVVISGILHGFLGIRGSRGTRSDRDAAAPSKSSRAGGEPKRMQSGVPRLTRCLTAAARAWGRTAGRAGLPIVCCVSVEWGKRWRLICPCRFWWLMTTAP